MLNDDERMCKNCGRLVEVRTARDSGMGMMELAAGPAAKCAGCSRNPGIGMVLGLMRALGAEPADNWIPIEGEPTC